VGTLSPQGDHKKGYVQFFFLEWMRIRRRKKVLFTTTFMQYINRLDTLNLIVPRNQFHQLISKENGYLKRMVIIEARLA
jgi:hypothetical protein